MDYIDSLINQAANYIIAFFKMKKSTDKISHTSKNEKMEIAKQIVFHTFLTRWLGL